jgi:putative transposase
VPLKVCTIELLEFSASRRLYSNCKSGVTKSVKAVKFGYTSTLQTQEMLETFRMMVNHAIHICLAEKIRGRLRLRDRIYKDFRERYGVVSCYPYSVAEVAWSIVKKHRRWHRRLVAGRLMMKMDSVNYSLDYGLLNLPFRKGERILLPLRYGGWQRSFLMDPSLKKGSVTITDSSVIVAFSKEIQQSQPETRVGLDLNEKSTVLSDGTKYDLSVVARIHTEYGVRRSEFCARHPRDKRLKHKFAGNLRERNRVRQVLNKTTKKIVEDAKAKKQVVVLECLKGISRVRRGDDLHSRGSRRRINQWPFRLFQSQIAYKAAWAGVPVEFVDPRNTSNTCYRCGFVNRQLKVTERVWQCPQCGCHLDCDLNAAVNIERRGKIPCLASVRPGAQGRGNCDGELDKTNASTILGEDVLKGGNRLPGPK